MKQIKKWLIIAPIAIIPSLFITQSDTIYNASPCLYAAACQEKTIGIKTTVKYGFPASYDQTITFKPTDTAISGLNDSGGDKNYLLIATNVLFWSLLLHTLAVIIQQKRKTKHAARR